MVADLLFFIFMLISLPSLVSMCKIHKNGKKKQELIYLKIKTVSCCLD